MPVCPLCGETASEAMINLHLDKGCPKRKTPAQASDEPSAKKAKKPLAEVLRPKTLDDYYGQPHLVGENGILRSLILQDRIPSLILWGPSGVGKTSFARLIANITKSRFVEMSATSSGTADIKKLIDDAKKTYKLLRQRTILFLDEIHRFNRAQQDSLLPAVENGDITLFGATTENPSFKLQSALLSRCQVFTLQKLSPENIRQMVTRALDVEDRKVNSEIIDHICESADGDGRMALNMLEIVFSLPSATPEQIKKSLKTLSNYDQKGENHYDFISALHKSVRGNDADAALYYLARMLQGGEDPLYISRRMIRMASEDIGLADDSCLPFAIATHTAVQQVGLPEADVMLAHCVVKLARAKKDVEVYKAWGLLKSELETVPGLSTAPIPMHLRNAPTKLMADLGYSEGYKYNPDYVGPVKQEYLPDIKVKKWLGRFQPSKKDSS